MSVIVNESIMVSPAEKTLRQSLWLSKLDMMIRQPYSHTPVLFTYHPKNGETSTPSCPTSTFFDAGIVKGALSKALVPYYPFAGRLKMNEDSSRYEIDCNDEGVLFIEAETTCTLSDLGDVFQQNYELRAKLIPKCDYSEGISSFPLLLVQITRFSCGGVTLCTATNHHVGDGIADMGFMKTWASLAKGIELSDVIVPSHDRAVYLAPRDPTRITFKHLEYEPPLPPLPPKCLSGETPTTVEHLFKLSEDQINALKLRAISHEAVSYKLSTFKVIAAHVWRSVCKSRGLADDQDVKLYMHTDGRSRLKDPSLPQVYFGNVLFFASSVAKAGDLIREPLWYTLGKIDEAVRRMDDPNYLRSAVDYLESQPDLTTIVRGPHCVTCPNFQINSWGRLPFTKVDFGLGGPKSTRLAESPETIVDGHCTIISSLTEDKSLYVAIRLFSSHMDLFQRHLYDF